jgi:hypothetical protein
MDQYDRASLAAVAVMKSDAVHSQERAVRRMPALGAAGDQGIDTRQGCKSGGASKQASLVPRHVSHGSGKFHDNCSCRALAAWMSASLISNEGRMNRPDG